MRIFALVIAALLTVTACQTTENIGSGPIDYIPEGSIKGYQSYRKDKERYPHHNTAFAYDTVNRTYTYSMSPQKKGSNAAIDRALELCKGNYETTNCKILDIDGRIVWKDIEPSIQARLTASLPEEQDSRTYEYDTGDYQISATQLGKFRSRAEFRQTYNFTAFFISTNGTSTGTAYVNGSASSGHESSIVSARQRCQIASPERKCYLFATNGEPVNEEARRALEREN
ncbi:MAG: hypothetical protein V7701_05455 [Sneathiella sp.]